MIRCPFIGYKITIAETMSIVSLPTVAVLNITTHGALMNGYSEPELNCIRMDSIQMWIYPDFFFQSGNGNKKIIQKAATKAGVGSERDRLILVCLVVGRVCFPLFKTGGRKCVNIFDVIETSIGLRRER